jgi:hypothetical protein
MSSGHVQQRNACFRHQRLRFVPRREVFQRRCELVYLLPSGVLQYRKWLLPVSAGNLQQLYGLLPVSAGHDVCRGFVRMFWNDRGYRRDGR